MSKSQSKEFFKKKQRGRNKKSSVGGGPMSTGGPSNSITATAKQFTIAASHASAVGLLGGGEDPALVVISPHPPTSLNQTKEKRTKICCLL
jgi:hypothetical protein